MNNLSRRLQFAVARFTNARSGLAAVEFAMLLPMMLTLYLGSVEVSQGIAINRKVTLTSHALADLASQYTSITDADMSNILDAATDIIAPYPSAKLQSVVSELSVDAQGTATVVWSDTLNGTARTVGEVVSIPATLAVANTYLVLGEAQYSYDPTYGYVLTGTMTLKDQFYLQPRQSTSISRTAS